MNIKLQIKDLLTPLNTVIGAIEKKQNLPILSHVLIQIQNNKIILSATNMEIEIHTSHDIKQQQNISWTIYAKDLLDIIKNLNPNSKIEFIIEKEKIYIKTQNNSFELNTLSSQEFPSLPQEESLNTITIDSEELKNLIKNTSFSMGNNDIRAYLNGLYLELNQNLMTIVATDGHRLSIAQITHKNNIKEKISIIIPKKTILEIIKLLENKAYTGKVNIKITKNYLYLNYHNTTINTRLIDGNFPNYSQVIPIELDNKITINRVDFLKSLHTAEIFVEDKNKGVKLIFKNSELHIFSHSERGQAKTQIETKKFDGDIEIGFNIFYLISILEKLKTDEIEMVIPGGEKNSCLLTNLKDDTYQYIIMPMRL